MNYGEKLLTEEIPKRTNFLATLSQRLMLHVTKNKTVFGKHMKGKYPHKLRLSADIAQTKLLSQQKRLLYLKRRYRIKLISL